jgi:putative inorganic carbon (HCO3(-)) transporter
MNTQMIEDLRRQRSGSAEILRRTAGEFPVFIAHQAELRCSSIVLLLLTPYLVLRREYVQKILLAIVILDIPLQLGTHFFYREADAVSGALGGLSISATTIALLGLYLSWFVRTIENRISNSRQPTKVNLSLLCYLAFTALSLFVAQDVRLSFFELFLLMQMYLLFLYVANSVRTREEVVFVVSFLLIGCLIESVVMVALAFSNLPSGLWGPFHLRVDTQPHGGFSRIGGTIGSPNEAGAYLSLLLSLAVSLLFSDTPRKCKWLAAGVIGVGAAALILTFSRGAWLSFFSAIVLFYVSLWRRNRPSFKVPLVAIAVLLISYLPFYNAVEGRLLADDNGSAQSRIPLMNLAFRIIADHPLLGVGSNNFSTVMEGYVTRELQQGFLYTVHNKYLLVWSEVGVGGLLAYLACLFGVLRKGWACWKFNDPLLAPLALGITAASLGYMVHQTVDIFHDRAVTQLLWLVAGLLFAMHDILRVQPAALDPFSSIT